MSLDYFLYIIVFVFALLIASFLNVLIYRLPRRESIVWPGSHCTCCGHKLIARDLLPLFSYLWLRGRCRYCSGKIAWRYPLVEVLTAGLFLLVFWGSSFSLETVIGCLFISILIVVAFTDIEKGIIPDFITYPGIIAGFFLSYFTVGIKSSFLGVFIFSGIFFLAAIISRGGMGGGDIKLAGLIGAFMGIKGALVVFVFSSLLGGLWALLLLLQGKAGRKTEIRFGPFLALAAVLVWLYGEKMISFYWQMLGQG